MADQSFKPSDKVTDQAFNRRLGDQDRRISALEQGQKSFDAVVADVLKLGLERINSLLVPTIETINAVSELGFLQARSQTELTLGDGDILTFVIDAGPQRDLFRPGAFVALTRLATIDDWAIARAVSYARDYGELIVEIVAIHGDAGPHADWEITAATGAVLAQVEMLGQVLAAKATIVSAADAVLPARDEVLAARDFIQGALADVSLIEATPENDGLMTAEDKAKLDMINPTDTEARLAALESDRRPYAYAVAFGGR